MLVCTWERTDDREIALRYCAFRSLGIENYKNYDSFDSFLGAALEWIETATEEKRGSLLDSLKASVLTSHAVFENHTFRKWPKDDERRHPINRALFEAWTLAFSDTDRTQVMKSKERIIAAARDAMTDDGDFIAAISQGTGKVAAVEYRFKKVREIVQEGLQ